MKKYQTIKVTGLGMIESRFEYHPTRLFFHSKEKSEEIANNMWLKYTTEKERKSGWCDLHYEVHEVK